MESRETQYDNEPIAIIGLGCRFPKAHDPQQFWSLLESGVDAITETPDDRWGDVPGAARWGGFLEDVYGFDAGFFAISEREAKVIDPQHRVFYEVVWQALENAALTKDILYGKPVAVFTGISTQDYFLDASDGDNLCAYTGTGNAACNAANRLSYLMNWSGPSMAVDTACSSSLVAVHLACRSLRDGECELAIAGGVNLLLRPELSQAFAMANMMAADGRCKTFDAAADGYVRGEGAGAVILKRLTRAQADGNPVLAVIKGSAVNQDGATNGLTAPNPAAQTAVVSQAWKKGAVDPDRIQYIELHGTGTLLGDPIEAKALGRAFAAVERSDGTPKCRLGSVKTNIGHLEAAAGIAGLIKVVLSMQHGALPPSLHFHKSNPYIDFTRLPFAVQTALEPWPESAGKRLAGISSFGFGGTNCHLLIESDAAASANTEPTKDDYFILCLAAKTPTALERLSSQYAAFLRNKSDTELQHICRATNTGRSQFTHRLAVHGASAKTLCDKLDRALSDKENRALSTSGAELENNSQLQSGAQRKKRQRRPKPTLAFLFSGQGCQYFAMARGLYRSQKVFRQTFDRCQQHLEGMLEVSLQDLLYSEHMDAGQIHQTRFAQPALTAVQLSLAALWQALGVKPDIVLGHSLGEYAAACVAGAMSEAQTLRLVASRGALTQKLSADGAMANVHSERQTLQRELAAFAGKLDIAAINGSHDQVVSGERVALDQLLERLATLGITSNRLSVGAAFHSALVEPILPELEAEAAKTDYRPLHIPLISSSTGTVFNVGQRLNKTHWRNHCRNPVQFQQCLTVLARYGTPFNLELGPAPVLCALAHRHAAQVQDSGTRRLFLPTLQKNADDNAVFYEALATLFTHGHHLRWEHLGNRRERQYTALPNYPFERKYLRVNSSIRPLPVHPAASVPQERERELDPDPVSLANISADTSTVVAHPQTQPSQTQPSDTIDEVRRIVARLLQTPAERIDTRVSFLELGADSLVLVSAVRQLEKTYGVTLQIRQFFEEIQSIEDLADYLRKHSPRRRRQPETTSLDNRAMRPTKAQQSVLPWRRADTRGGAHLDTAQQRHCQILAQAYCEKTRGSKAWAQRYRSTLADNRACAGFRFTTKEMLYPIVAEHAAGAFIWDVDGNRYTDISMGFGVHLLGHEPPAVKQALIDQLDRGMPLGPQAPLAGEVAELIQRCTGQERVMFTNSGTEAVMTALRLARACRGRDKLVMFEGSYHGHFDGTLAFAAGEEASEPMAPGVTPAMVRDIWVLEYGNDSALDFIHSHADELAAVLIEPVQSRHPALQPAQFIRHLRDITRQTGVLLIMDEMITGFRIALGGAQEYFGVDADIATYGKIVGGGLPIGIVAGKRRYMDRVDGGQWQYGDASYPAVETTFFAGTFCKHPLTLAASRAVLMHLLADAGELYPPLNARTRALATRLNNFFAGSGAPLRVEYFGSLFRFVFSGNQDLFFYYLLDKGIYIWEGRNCFLSTAHTDADIDNIFDTVVETSRELQRTGFWHSPERDAESLLLPLTESQAQLWRLSQVSARGHIAYNITAALDISGPFQLPALARAAASTARRHQSLRTCICTDGLHQRVVSKVDLTPLFECLNAADTAPTAASERRLKAKLLQASQTPFDLSKPPLARLHLFQLGQQQHCLLLVIHHIIADGLSTQLLLEEIMANYRQETQAEGQPPLANTRGKIPVCSEMAIGEKPLADGQSSASGKQLQDWIAWQTQIKTTPQWQRERDYWLQTLATYNNPMALPTDNPRPPTRRYRGRRVRLPLPAPLWDGVVRQAKKNACTPFNFLLAVYFAWLHRLSPDSQLLVGIPVSGRNHAGSESVIAYYTHLLPILMERPQDPTAFSTLLKQLQSQLLDGFANANYPLAEMLRERRNPQGSLNQSAPAQQRLIDVVFNLDTILGQYRIPGCTVTRRSLSGHQAKFDLSLNLTLEQGELTAELDYDSDLFLAATARRFLGQYTTLLQAVVDTPDADVRTLPLLTPVERARWRRRYRTADSQETPPLLLSQFTAQVQANPNNPAVSDGKRTLDYWQLNALADRLAHQLDALALPENPCIGLWLPRQADTIVAMLAVFKVAGCFVPIDPSTPTARVRELLNTAQCQALVTTPENPGASDVDGAAVFAGPVIPLVLDHRASLATAGVAQRSIGEPTVEAHPCVPHPCEPHYQAYIVFTSGSTGTPKGVCISQRALSHYCRAAAEALALPPASRCAVVSTLAADLGYTLVFPALAAGAHLHLPTPQVTLEPQAFCAYMQTHAIDCLKIVPSHFKALMEAAEAGPFMPAQRLILGGEACELEFVRRLHGSRPSCRIYNHYGPTETTVGALVREYRGGGREAGQRLSNLLLDRALASCDLYLLDRHMAEVPPGMAGELYIGGPALADGYLGRAAATAERFVPNPFRCRPADCARLYATGDRFRWLPGGALEWLGRNDDQVKIRGFRVEPGELASHLLRHPGVRQALVTVSGQPQPALIAYIVPEPAQGSAEKLCPQTLRQWLKNNLPEQMLPSHWVFMERFPISGNGKIDRAALPAPTAAESTVADPPPARQVPMTALEQQLQHVWQEILGRPYVDPEANYFALGGDSIQSIQITGRLAAAGLSIRTADIYQYPSIRLLAQRLAAAGESPAHGRGQPSITSGPVPLTPAQQRFFTTQDAAPQQWNMSVLLALDARVTAEHVKQAFSFLVRHHRSLGLCFNREDIGWHQRYSENPAFSFIELSHRQRHTLAQQQQYLNIRRGENLRLIWLPDRVNELMIVIHHLVIDGVSWRILLADFDILLKQQLAGTPLQLAPPSASYQAWGQALLTSAGSSRWLAQRDYWLNLPAPGELQSLPQKQHAHAHNIVANERLYTTSLDAHTTALLLDVAADTYGAEPVELLLTALVDAAATWLQQDRVYLLLEGHGREPLDDVTDTGDSGNGQPLDLSRSIGWFTSHYPLLLTWQQHLPPAAAVQHIKKQFRSVPDKGLGYGLLRYLSPPEQGFAQTLATAAEAEISFNYLGSLDRLLPDDALLQIRRPQCDNERASQSPRGALLHVEAMVFDDCLQCHWKYSYRSLYTPDVEQLGANCMTALLELLDHTAPTANATKTPPVDALKMPREKAKQSAPSSVPETLSNEDFNDILNQVNASTYEPYD